MKTETNRLLSIAAVAVLGTALTGVVGCQGGMNPFRGATQDDRAMIAAASQAEFPDEDGEESNDFIVLDERGTFRLENRSDRSLRNVKVWLNSTFVQQIDTLPQGGSVDLAKNRFYDRQGVAYTQFNRNRMPSTIHLQADDDFYRLRSPIAR